MTGKDALNWYNELGGVRSRDAARDLDYKEREYLPITNTWTSAGPYWDCVIQGSGTFTPGTDWSSYFEQEKLGTNRVPFRVATAGGELFLTHPEGSQSNARRLAVLRVYANEHQSITGTYSFNGTGSDIQINVNGTLTEIAGSASGQHTFTLIPGYNTIKVVCNLDVDDLALHVRLFDDFLVRWVNPNADRNPTRGGVTPISNDTTAPGRLDVVPDMPEIA
jgi:hypothetical protein